MAHNADLSRELESRFHRHWRCAAGLVAAALAVSCGGEVGPAPPAPGAVTAFVGVSVIPMDSERVLEAHTVVVRDDRIEALGPVADTPVPPGAVEIDGTGRYLMPGLAEMHGHLPNPNTPQVVTENVLFLYVANGVTTVRGMQGHPSQLSLRDRIALGELVGPQLFLGSPSMSGASVSTVDDAIRLVREYAAAGFDLLKVHEGLSAEVYDAIAATANEIGIPFGGHVSDTVGLLHALEAGQSTVDHLDNYVEALVPPAAQPAAIEPLRGVERLVDLVDESRLTDLVRATVMAGASVVPTMVLWETGILATRPSSELVEGWSELVFMPSETVDGWIRAVDERVAGSSIEANRRVAALRRRILMALHAGGASILLGTDSPQIFSVPGFSIHRELQLWVDSGMSPYEVLATGTREVGEYFGTPGTLGIVAVGQRADLLLLEASPFEDIGNVARRAGVMVNGRWVAEEQIQERLAAIAGSYLGG